MSPDELIVTGVAVVLGPVLWAAWLFRMSRVQRLQRRGFGLAVLAAALLACTALIFYVLRTAASFDVVNAAPYLFMYVVLGLAWLNVADLLFPFAGLSPRDDVVERGNGAAAAAHAGALLGVALCYAGGNIGDGPGWWVVIFSAALATAALIVAWTVLAVMTAVADAVTIDRDPAAGLRLGAFLLASGLVLGRGVAGDWESAAATLADFTAAIPGAATLLIAAVIVERLARPTPRQPRPSLLVWGLLPSILYLAVAAGAVRMLGWPA